MAWKIGVDGGGTKTECVLLDPSGAVAARHTGPGCSPSLVGMDRAMELAAEVIRAVRAGHESLTELCTRRNHLRITAELGQVVAIRLEISFLDNVTLHSLLASGSGMA